MSSLSHFDILIFYSIVIQSISALLIHSSNRLCLKSMTEGANVKSSSLGSNISIPEAPIGQEVMKACIEITV